MSDPVAPPQPAEDPLVWLTTALSRHSPPPGLNPKNFNLDASLLVLYLQTAQKVHAQQLQDWGLYVKKTTPRSKHARLVFDVDLVARDLRRFGYPLIEPSAVRTFRAACVLLLLTCRD